MKVSVTSKQSRETEQTCPGVTTMREENERIDRSHFMKIEAVVKKQSKKATKPPVFSADARYSERFREHQL